MISSTSLAIVVAIALLLRPSRIVELALPVPSRIPASARAQLKAQMQKHGSQMIELLQHVLVLDHDGAAHIAGDVYDQPTIQKGDKQGIGAYLPPRFFELQEQLRQQARALVLATAQKESVGAAQRFGALTTTCVQCHEAYMFPQGTEGSVSQP